MRKERFLFVTASYYKLHRKSVHRVARMFPATKISVMVPHKTILKTTLPMVKYISLEDTVAAEIYGSLAKGQNAKVGIVMAKEDESTPLLAKYKTGSLLKGVFKSLFQEFSYRDHACLLSKAARRNF